MKRTLVFFLLPSLMSAPFRLASSASVLPVLPLQVTLEPSRARAVYRKTDTVEWLLQNQGRQTLDISGRTQLVTGAGQKQTYAPLFFNISITPDMLDNNSIPPCIHLRPVSSERIRIPVSQLIGYGNPQELVAAAQSQRVRIRLVFKDCDRRQADSIVSSPIQVQL
jgi:hypothetical protein